MSKFDPRFKRPANRCGSFSNDFPDFGDFIRRNIARFALTVELLAAAIAVADPPTPAWAKTILAAVIAYVLCPLDAIPDFIPIVGWTDDVGVLGAAVSGAARDARSAAIRRRRRLT